MTYTSGAMTSMKQKYIEQVDINYLINTKLKFSGILKERGWTVKKLSLESDIPESTIYGWLDTGTTEFMSLPAASKVCRTMKISIHELLADPMWIGIDKNRYLFVRPWMEEDIEIVELVTKFYFNLKQLIKKAG